MIRRDMHEINRRSWNAVTAAHNSHKVDEAGFLRGGGSTLFPEETALLGDVRAQRVAHLQCNCGQDSLSIARLGARVTGVDISDEAIGVAQALSRDSGIAATFARADVYDWLEAADPASFDVAFSSYGAIPWLSDLAAWARGVARILAPGGRLVVVEFHPVAWMFDERLERRCPYFRDGAPVQGVGVGDYVGTSGDALTPSGWQEGVREFVNPHPEQTIDWGIGEIMTAILGAGLNLRAFQEYPYANGFKVFDDMVETGGRRFVLPAGAPSLPLMYSLVAER